jgi:beta-glucosidase-like glycosyl hydrolase
VRSPLAGLVFPALRFRPAHGGFAHERAKIDAALAAGVGGFILFGGDRPSVTTLTANLRQAATRPLLIGADLERGPGQQVVGLTELPPPAALGTLKDLDITTTAGMITATEARAAGLNWAFAPVADLDVEPENPIVQTRSFGPDPDAVSAQVGAWIGGCQDHGVLACAKHYPGHGRTTQDSHITLPRVSAPMKLLEETDVAPFAAAVRAGVGSVMSAFVAYPGWDPTGRAASFSPVILGHLRDALGFRGVVVTDALIMAGATAREAETAATTTAIVAGCDGLLYPNDWARVVSALDHAVGRDLPASRADAALARCADAAATWTKGADQGDPDLVAHATFADKVADRVIGMIRGTPPALQAPLSVTIVDDDVGGPYAIESRDAFAETLRAGGVAINPRPATGGRVVLVFAEPRSWKGRADLGARSRAQLRALAPSATLVVLFAHPRLAQEIPGGAPLLGAWHGQALMQRAAARWVGARLG